MKEEIKNSFILRTFNHTNRFYLKYKPVLVILMAVTIAIQIIIGTLIPALEDLAYVLFYCIQLPLIIFAQVYMVLHILASRKIRLLAKKYFTNTSFIIYIIDETFAK